MNAEMKVYTGATMTDRDFAILIEALTANRSGIIYGVRSTVSPSSNAKIDISAGWITIRGRLISVEKGDLVVTLPSSGEKNYKIVVTVNLSNSESPITFSAMETVPRDSDSFNQVNGTAYFVIATVTATPTGLTNMNPTPLMSRVPEIRVGTAAPNNNDGSSDGDIYIQYKA